MGRGFAIPDASSHLVVTGRAVTLEPGSWILGGIRDAGEFQRLAKK
jgi:hypothetical protein